MWNPGSTASSRRFTVSVLRNSAFLGKSNNFSAFSAYSARPTLDCATCATYNIRFASNSKKPREIYLEEQRLPRYFEEAYDSRQQDKSIETFQLQSEDFESRFDHLTIQRRGDAQNLQDFYEPKYFKPQSLPKNASVVVIGGGISGLTFAFYLCKIRPDIRIKLVEKNTKLGGWVDGKDFGIPDDCGNNLIVNLDFGPHTARLPSIGSVLLAEIMSQIGKEHCVQTINGDLPATRGSYLLTKEEKLVGTPMYAPFEYFWSSLGRRTLFRILMEPLSDHKDPSIRDESVYSFLRRRIGPKAAFSLGSAVIHGIYAGDFRQLSARALLKRMYLAEEKYGSLGRYFLARKSARGTPLEDGIRIEKEAVEELVRQRYATFFPDRKHFEPLLVAPEFKRRGLVLVAGGLKTLIRELWRYLEAQPNVDIRCGSEAVALKYDKSVGAEPLSVTIKSGAAGRKHVETLPAAYVHSTVAAPVVGKLLEPYSATVATHCATIPFVSVYVVCFWLPSNELAEKYKGFGYLVPQPSATPEHLLGVIFDSNIEKETTLFWGKRLKKAIGYTESGNVAEVAKVAENAENAENAAYSRRIAKYSKVTVMLGGEYYQDPRNIPESDEAAVELAKQVLKRHVKIDIDYYKDEEIFYAAKLNENCIPQYPVGHVDATANVLDEVEDIFGGSVRLAGSSFSTEVGLPDQVSAAFVAATSLA